MNQSAQFKSIIVSVLVQLALNAGTPEVASQRQEGQNVPTNGQPLPSPVSMATVSSFQMVPREGDEVADDDDAQSVAGSEATEISLAEPVQVCNLDQDVIDALQADELGGALRSLLKGNVSTAELDISLADTSFVEEFGANKQIIAAILMSSAKRGGTVGFDSDGNIQDILDCEVTEGSPNPALILGQTEARTDKRDASSKAPYHFAIQNSRLWYVKDTELLPLIDEEVKVRAAVLAYQNGVGTDAFVNGIDLVQHDLINQAIGKEHVLVSILTGSTYTYTEEDGTAKNGTHWFGLKFMDIEENECVAYCPLDSLNHSLKLQPTDANPNEYPVQRQLVTFGNMQFHTYDLNTRKVASKILSEIASLANSTRAQVRDVASILADIMPDTLSSDDKVKLIKQMGLDGKLSYTLAKLTFGESLEALEQYQGVLDSILKATSIIKESVQQRGQGR